MLLPTGIKDLYQFVHPVQICFFYLLETTLSFSTSIHNAVPGVVFIWQYPDDRHSLWLPISEQLISLHFSSCSAGATKVGDTEKTLKCLFISPHLRLPKWAF